MFDNYNFYSKKFLIYYIDTIFFRINAKQVFMGGGFLRQYFINDVISEGEYEGEYEYAEDGEYEYYDYTNEGAETKLPDDQVDQRERRRRRRAEDISYDESSYSYDETAYEDEVDYEEVSSGGGIQTAKSYMFDGSTWEELAPMNIARDRPACSIISMPDGKVKRLHNYPQMHFTC